MFNYMQLMQKLHVRLGSGTRPDRTQTGTASIFDHALEYDLGEYFPLLPYREVNFKDVVVELLWFLRGDTNIAYLEKHGCKWWTNQCSNEGEVGPMYGAQWRGYTDANGVKHPDQFKRLIENLRKDPFSRHHIVDSWAPDAIPESNRDYDGNVKAGKMAIAPCHSLYQCYVEDINGERTVSLKFYMRSSDTFLGLPANIASYGALLEIIGGLTGYRPRRLLWNGGDVHLYSNHDEGCSTLIKQWREMVAEQFDKDKTSIYDRYRAWDLKSEKLCPKFELPKAFIEHEGVQNLDFTDDALVDLLVSGLKDYKPGPAIKVRMAR